MSYKIPVHYGDRLLINVIHNDSRPDDGGSNHL
jgi:hypothetical protein